MNTGLAGLFVGFFQHFKYVVSFSSGLHVLRMNSQVPFVSLFPC